MNSYLLQERKKKVIFSSSSPLQVNDSVFSLKDNGILVVIIDACTGLVSGRKLFSGADVKRVDGYLKSGIPQRCVQ